jgi:hypothetical protein
MLRLGYLDVIYQRTVASEYLPGQGEELAPEPHHGHLRGIGQVELDLRREAEPVGAVEDQPPLRLGDPSDQGLGAVPNPALFAFAQRIDHHGPVVRELGPRRGQVVVPIFRPGRDPGPLPQSGGTKRKSKIAAVAGHSDLPLHPRGSTHSVTLMPVWADIRCCASPSLYGHSRRRRDATTGRSQTRG